MSSVQKLTKKQKKGLAFREGKAGKRKGNGGPDMEDNAVPAMEDQDLAGGDGGAGEVPGDDRPKKGKEVDNQGRDAGKPADAKAEGKGKGKAKAEDVRESVQVVKKSEASKKRKRETDDDAGEGDEGAEDKKSTSAAKPSKKKKKSAADSKDEKEKPSKQRFILFLGNLKYTTPLEMIQKHFASCDPPPTVRLLTPKKVPGAPAMKPKSKGCAFLEFTHRNALQQGLKLHQSTLDGRQINVELTAGGGGKSETRLSKVKERNKSLYEQREERVEKEIKETGAFPNLPSKPQRFSATSGLDIAPSTKRTWTVGDVEETETHRGGQRHRKKEKSGRPAKSWGTGVNSIPVG